MADNSEESPKPSTKKDNKKNKKQKKEVPETGGETPSSSVDNGGKKKEQKKKEEPVNQTGETPSTSTSSNDGKKEKKKKEKKEKPKKTDKKSKSKPEQSFQAPQANSFQSHSLAGDPNTNVQMDDFHETPSCFSKLSNPLKKKHGYDFETIAESSSIHYQEVPVSIETAPANTKAMGEVTVNAKEDGSLPPVKNHGPPLNRHTEPGFVQYTDPRDHALPDTSRKADNPKLPIPDVKKYEDRIEQLEKESKKHQETVLEYKAQMVKLTKEKDDLTVRLSTELDRKVGKDESTPENMNIKSRPLTLAEEFALLSSSEWMAAKEALDQYCDMSEYDQLTILCDIMLEAAKVCSKRFEEILPEVALQITQPFSYTDKPELTNPQNGSVDSPHTVSSEKSIYKMKPDSQVLRESVVLENIFGETQVQDNTSLQNSDADDRLKTGESPSLSKHGSNIEEKEGMGAEGYDIEQDTYENTYIGVTPKTQDPVTDSDKEKDGTELQRGHSNQSDAESSGIVKPDVANGSSKPSDALSKADHVSHQSKMDNENPKKNCVIPTAGQNQHEKVKIPENLEKAITELMRESVDKVNVTEASHVINEYVERLTGLPLRNSECLQHLEPLAKYITACLEFTWAMALQRPPMVFSTKGIGHPWNELYQDPWHGSDHPDSLSAVVLLYRCPVLLHGDKVLVKGTVLIKEQLDSE